MISIDGQTFILGKYQLQWSKLTSEELWACLMAAVGMCKPHLEHLPGFKHDHPEASQMYHGPGVPWVEVGNLLSPTKNQGFWLTRRGALYLVEPATAEDLAHFGIDEPKPGDYIARPLTPDMLQDISSKARGNLIKLMLKRLEELLQGGVKHAEKQVRDRERSREELYQLQHRVGLN